ncbi:VOC family protein [Bacillus sp. KH172YL63]|uniref:VOC family protein n=1 Tax=Bacillus sp. KH172YL63 TaxID=2709784 RepID=UPI0013E44CBB|nr:VOC family protein [Bacillus sp. KH172YL63]BCB03669.1 lactoylglutathione lyase [Bacillus sp. KH172YL63]
MISKVGQIMLYVKDQDKAVAFWRDKLGFAVVREVSNQGMRWIEIAPSEKAETTIVLHDKELISQLEPELNLGTPSLMMFSDNLEALHSRLHAEHITVGEMVDMPGGKVFNFADSEGNYFAVMENVRVK